MQYSAQVKRILVITLSYLAITCSLQAQQLLNKQVSLNARREPLQKVLEQIGEQGGFYFSYNSNLVAGDSLVSLSVKDKTVKQVLDLLFRSTLQYKEMEGLIILQHVTSQQYWYISGYIQDGISGERLNSVSIYEREHLAGTITDDKGYFRLQLKEKNRYPPVIRISVSRVSYEDTAFQVYPGFNQEVQLSVSPSNRQLEGVVVTPRVQKTWLGKLMISSRLKKQSSNIRNFLATKPIQFSVTPGLGTHGQLGAQVVNKFSFSLLGGYTAGVNGFELGGLFNITQGDVDHVQVGGLFNVVGGKVRGLHVAGLHNKVLDSVRGLEVAGLVNIVKGSVTGFQASGLVSNINGRSEGMIISGLVSQIGGEIQGLQVAGITSIGKGTVKGTQISGIYNSARNLKGWQLGFINYADTATGYSIGFININRQGFHKFSAGTTDLLDLSVTYKAGNRHFYTLLTGGANIVRKKAFGIGYGLGNEITFNKDLSLSNELTTMGFYNGNWENSPVITSFRTSVHFRVFNKYYAYAGPSISVGEVKPAAQKGYADVMPGHTAFDITNAWRGWFGWQVGISL